MSLMSTFTISFPTRSVDQTLTEAARSHQLFAHELCGTELRAEQGEGFGFWGKHPQKERVLTVWDFRGSQRKKTHDYRVLSQYGIEEFQSCLEGPKVA